MRVRIVIMLLMLFGLEANAKLYVLKSSFKSQFIGDDMQFWKDDNCAFTIDSICNSILNWEPLSKQNQFFWKADHCNWYHFSVFNESRSQKNIIVEISNFQIDSLDFYLVRNGKLLDNFYTGNARGFISRAIYDRNFLFEIKLPRGQGRDLYFKTYPQANLMSFPVTIWDENDKFNKSQLIEWSKGLLFGVVILFFSIAFYLSVILRIKNYFLYGLHVMMGTLYYFVLQGIGLEFFWLDRPKLQSLLSYILLNLFLITTIIFLKEFLKRRFLPSWLNFFLKSILFISVFFSACDVFLNFMPLKLLSLFLTMQNIGLFLIMISIFIVLFFGYFKVKEQSLYLVSMSFFLFLSLIIINPLLNNIFSPNSWMYLFSVHLGGWVLGFSIATLLVKRSTTILKANKNLRSELGLLNKRYGFYLLEGAEKERKRVAEELHDGIGISLATIKMKMSLLMSETEDLTLIRFLGTNIKGVDAQCEKVRNLSHQLREKTLERYGLSIAVQDFLESLNATKKINYSFRQNLKTGELSPITEMAIYKIVKVLLKNIWKLDIVSLELRIIVFYSTEKAMLKLTTEGEGFNINLPIFAEFKNIVLLLHGEIIEYTPNAISKMVDIEIPILLKWKKE